MVQIPLSVGVFFSQRNWNSFVLFTGDNTESNPFDPELGYVETVSDYVKKMCAYCSHDLAARQFSGNTDSMNIYSITESYEDYDIVDSQVVNVIESDFGDGGKTGEGVEDLVAEISGGEKLKGSDLEWAVLSIKDVSLGNKCTCSDQVRGLHFFMRGVGNENFSENRKTCPPPPMKKIPSPLPL